MELVHCKAMGVRFGQRVKAESCLGKTLGLEGLLVMNQDSMADHADCSSSAHPAHSVSMMFSVSSGGCISKIFCSVFFCVPCAL